MINGFVQKLNVLLTKKQKQNMLVLFAVMLVGAFLEAFGVSVVVPFVAVITRDDFIEKIPLLSRVFHSLGFSSPSQFALACMVVLILVYLVKAAYLVFEYRLQAKFVSDCKFGTQERLVKTFLNKPYSYYLNRNSAEMHRLLVSDLNKVFQMLQQILAMMTDFVVSVVLLITLFIINPLMSACVMLIIIITVFLTGRIIRPRLDAAGRIVMTNERIRSRWISQGFTGIKEIKHIHSRNVFPSKDLTLKA